MALSSLERQYSYIERMEAKGFKKLQIWVPAEKMEQIKKYIERMKKESSDGDSI